MVVNRNTIQPFNNSISMSDRTGAVLIAHNYHLYFDPTLKILRILPGFYRNLNLKF